MSWNDTLEGEALNIAGSQSRRLRVMAGPGTGKSYAMKKRIMRLIEDEQVEPEKIHAMTLHAFCFWLLNQKDVFDQLQRKPRPLKTFNSKGSPQFELSPLLADLDLVQNFGNKRAKFKIIKAFEAAWARTQIAPKKKIYVPSRELRYAFYNICVCFNSVRWSSDSV